MAMRTCVSDGAEAQLRQNITELMEWRHMNQADLAAKLDRTQPWVSKRMSGKTKFTVPDLDALCVVFLLEPHQLLRPGHGKWERRKHRDRRSGHERRGATYEVRPFPERQEHTG